METETEYIIVLTNGAIYKCILKKDINFEPFEYNTEEEFKKYIITLADMYSALSWASFITNISAFLSQDNPQELCLLFAFINLNIRNIMKVITKYNVKYLVEFYYVAQRIHSQVKTSDFDMILINTITDITQETSDIVEQIIWECDYYDSTILNCKTAIAKNKANKFKHTILYDELIATSFYDIKRMRDNGLIEYI